MARPGRAQRRMPLEIKLLVVRIAQHVQKFLDQLGIPRTRLLDRDLRQIVPQNTRPQPAAEYS